VVLVAEETEVLVILEVVLNQQLQVVQTLVAVAVAVLKPLQLEKRAVRAL
jgi:hypothetical protein